MDWVSTFLGGTRARILELLRRSTSTIGDLAESVGVTGNAVRGHLAALQKDGLVREVGSARSTGGKPAQLYDLTPQGEEAFPKAYAFVLRELVRGLEERDGRDATIDLLRTVGRSAAGAGGAPSADRGARVVAAAELLRSVGGDVTVTRVEGGWEIRGFGCPLSAVVVAQPDACCLTEGLVAGVTGAAVEERCERSDGRARCAFLVHET